MAHDHSSAIDREKRLVRCLGGLSEVMRGNLTVDGIHIWRNLLAEYPIEVIEEASVHLAKTETFMPVPSVMIEQCVKITERNEVRRLRARTNIDDLLLKAKQPPGELVEHSESGATVQKLLSGAKVMEAKRADYDTRVRELRKQIMTLESEKTADMTDKQVAAGDARLLMLRAQAKKLKDEFESSQKAAVAENAPI